MRVTTATNDHSGLHELAPEVVGPAHAYSAAIYGSSKLPLRLFEAARIETALINGCMMCMNFQTARDSAAATEGGLASNGPAPDQDFYDTVLARRTDGLDEREIAAVEFARGMGANPHGLATDEPLWARMKQLFTDAEIVDLTYCVAGLIAMGRVVHVLGSDQGCEIPATAKANVESIKLQQATSMVSI